MFDLENFILDETTSKYKLMAIESICEDGRGRVMILSIKLDTFFENHAAARNSS